MTRKQKHVSKEKEEEIAKKIVEVRDAVEREMTEVRDAVERSSQGSMAQRMCDLLERKEREHRGFPFYYLSALSACSLCGGREEKPSGELPDIWCVPTPHVRCHFPDGSNLVFGEPRSASGSRWYVGSGPEYTCWCPRGDHDPKCCHYVEVTQQVLQVEFSRLSLPIKIIGVSPCRVMLEYDGARGVFRVEELIRSLRHLTVVEVHLLWRNMTISGSFLVV